MYCASSGDRLIIPSASLFFSRVFVFQMPSSVGLPEPLDIHAFTQAGGMLSGELSSAQLPRLDDVASGDPTLIGWSFSGHSQLRADGSREARAELSLSGQVRMACTRCLQPLQCRLDEHRELRFVGTESQAESEDADDESFDVLVASRSFDLLGLIEDEVLLALPPAPRHTDCTLPVAPENPTAPQIHPAGAQDSLTKATDAARHKRPQAAQQSDQNRGLAAAMRAAQERREKGGAKD